VVRNGISSWITVLCVASTVRGSARQYGGADPPAGLVWATRLCEGLRRSGKRRAVAAIRLASEWQAGFTRLIRHTPACAGAIPPFAGIAEGTGLFRIWDLVVRIWLRPKAAMCSL